MILPPHLVKNDTIGIFSPSYPASSAWQDCISRAVSFLEEKGFHIQFGSLRGKQDFYRSGTIQERADELNELIASPTVKCIMAVAGGFVSNSLLPYINYEHLRNNPKIIIGYSDVTAILLAVYAKTGITSYYGPTLASFGRKPPIFYDSYDYMCDILCTPQALPYTLPTPALWTEDTINVGEPYEYKTYPNEWITLHGGITQGRLIACNLSTLLGFMASQYMPDINHGDILLIEDKNLDAETMERSFSMLKVCGVFDKIGGLIVGKHIDFLDRGTKRKHYDILHEVMGEVDFPVLAEFDCSHAMPMLTMPIGCKVRLDATQKTVTLLEKWID